MVRPFTVFFDTYFYVWLANATDHEANETINSLNMLQVRHVLSSHVLVELLTHTKNSDKDKALFNRITKLEIPPFKILKTTSNSSMNAENLTWDGLLISGNNRHSLSSLFKSIYDLETMAESYSIIASRELPRAQQEKLNEAILPFAESIGLNKISEGDDPPEEFLSFINQLFSNVSHVLNQEQTDIFSQIDFNIPVTQENAESIKNQLFNIIGQEDLKWLEEGGRVLNSVTKSDNRPFKVVTEEASPKEIKQLGNTYRDSANMLSFEKNESEIDLLQLDKAQISLLKVTGRNLHRFTEIGLSNRCFCTNSLKSTIEYLKKAKQRFSS